MLASAIERLVLIFATRKCTETDAFPPSPNEASDVTSRTGFPLRKEDHRSVDVDHAHRAARRRYGTVRTLLKQIYARLGVSRQLVLALSSLPALRNQGRSVAGGGKGVSSVPISGRQPYVCNLFRKTLGDATLSTTEVQTGPF